MASSKTTSPASDDNNKRKKRGKSRTAADKPISPHGSSSGVRSGKSPVQSKVAPRSEPQIRASLLEIYVRHAAETDDATAAANNAIAEIRTTTIPEELISTIILEYSKIRITAARADTRYALKMAAKGDERAIESVAASRETWLDGYYVGNIRLRNCTADDLRASARSKTSMADGLLTASTFETTLAGKIGSRKVGEVMTDRQVAKLWNDLEKRC